MSIEASQGFAPKNDETPDHEYDGISFDYDSNNPGANFTNVEIDLKAFESLTDHLTEENPYYQTNVCLGDDGQFNDWVYYERDYKHGNYAMKIINNQDGFSDKLEIRFGPNEGNIITKREILERENDPENSGDDSFEVSSVFSSDSRVQVSLNTFTRDEYDQVIVNDPMYIPGLGFAGGPDRLSYIYDSDEDEYSISLSEADGQYRESGDSNRGSKPISELTDIQFVLDQMKPNGDRVEYSSERLPADFLEILPPLHKDSNLIEWEDLLDGVWNGLYDKWTIWDKLVQNPILVTNDSQFRSLSFDEIGEQLRDAYPTAKIK